MGNFADFLPPLGINGIAGLVKSTRLSILTTFQGNSQCCDLSSISIGSKHFILSFNRFFLISTFTFFLFPIFRLIFLYFLFLFGYFFFESRRVQNYNIVIFFSFYFVVILVV